MNFNHKKLLVIDFETTGLDSKNDQILEIGAVLLTRDSSNNYQVVEELNELVLTSMPLPNRIIEITGITDEMVLREGIEEVEAFKKVSSLIDSQTLLIAYNIQFDLGFLTTLFRKHDNSFVRINNDICDVMAIYKDRNKYPHRLESAIAKYNVKTPSTHRALDDAKATVELLKLLAAETPNLSLYINKIGYNSKYGVSGPKLPHVEYIAQAGEKREIENLSRK